MAVLATTSRAYVVSGSVTSTVGSGKPWVGTLGTVGIVGTVGTMGIVGTVGTMGIVGTVVGTVGSTKGSLQKGKYYGRQRKTMTYG